MGEEPNENVGQPFDPRVDRTSATTGLPSAPTGTGEGSQDVHALKADIEQTRAEIGETLQAIEERLTPSQVAANAAQSVRETASRRMEHMMSSVSDKATDMAEQTRESVRDNPMSAAMLGIGLGYLVYRSMRGRRSHASWRRPGDAWVGYEAADDGTEYGPAYGNSEYGGRSFMQSVGDNPVPAALTAIGIGWMLRNARSESGGEGMWSESQWDTDYDDTAAGFESGTARATTGTNALGEWKESAQEMASTARERVGRATRQTSQRLSRRSSQLGRMFRDNPIPFGVAALAIGTAVGLSVPETETENQWMGEARDNVLERAREAKDAVVDRAKSLATDATGNAPGNTGSTPQSS